MSTTDSSDDESVSEIEVETDGFEEEAETEYYEVPANESNYTDVLSDEDLELPGVTCDECQDIVFYRNQSYAVQGELRRFLQQQDAGLDCSFRCMRCRDCKLCLKGAGEERKSMMQEAHQEFIRQSVSIDKELGRAVAKLPFVVDPVGKLTNNTRLASRRLDNVCKKYGKDENIKNMINHSFY